MVSARNAAQWQSKTKNYTVKQKRGGNPPLFCLYTDLSDLNVRQHHVHDHDLILLL
jgi:hypothetical protein